MRTYPSEEWKILSYAVLIPNMDWYTSVLNFTEAEYAEYDEWLEQFGLWAGTIEHVVQTMNFKDITNNTHDLLFRSNIISTKETTASNICLEYLFGYL